MMTPLEADTAPLTYTDFQRLAPAAAAALLALGRSVDEAGLDKSLTELVKLRVSQINGCAFCTGLHLAIARRLGVDAVKLDLTAVWRDAGVFSPREKAALAWAEQLTRMGHDPVPDTAGATLSAHFSPAEIVHLTVTIAAINGWNRIAGGLRFPPPPTGP